MGKARNLALATSIAAVQEDSSALWQQPNQPIKPASQTNQPRLAMIK